MNFAARLPFQIKFHLTATLLLRAHSIIVAREDAAGVFYDHGKGQEHRPRAELKGAGHTFAYFSIGYLLHNFQPTNPEPN
jgi:hypothetical protein